MKKEKLPTRDIREMVKSGLKGRDALRIAVSLSDEDSKRQEELSPKQPKKDKKQNGKNR